MKTLYFAYGSNLNMEQMSHRCPKAVPVSAAKLVGWKLRYSTHADIVRSRGGTVYGALYELRPSDEAALDRYEGVGGLSATGKFSYGYYTKVQVRVVSEGEPVYAMTYVMSPGHTVSPPSTAYLIGCMIGMVDWALPVTGGVRAAVTEALGKNAPSDPLDAMRLLWRHDRDADATAIDLSVRAGMMTRAEGRKLLKNRDEG